MNTIFQVAQGVCLCVVAALVNDDMPRQSEVMRKMEQDKLDAARASDRRAQVPPRLQLATPTSDRKGKGKEVQRPEGPPGVQ